METHGNPPPPLDPQRLGEALGDHLAAADQERAAAFAHVAFIQGATQVTLALERRRLIARLGDDHPEVKRLDLKLAQSQRLAAGASVDLERAKVAPPLASDDSWIVHGFVKTEAGKSVVCARVEVWNAGKLVDAIETRPSDATGYYLTRVRAAAGQTLDTGSGPGSPTHGAIATNLPKKLVLRVVDRQGALVVEVTPSVTLRAGRVDSVDIVVPEGCHP